MVIKPILTKRSKKGSVALRYNEGYLALLKVSKVLLAHRDKTSVA